MSSPDVPAIIAAGVSGLTLIGTVVTQIIGFNSTRANTERQIKATQKDTADTLAQQREQLQMARSFPGPAARTSLVIWGVVTVARNDDKPAVPPAVGAMGPPATPAGKPADRRPGRLVWVLRRRWWPRFLLAGALVIVVGATLVSGAAAPWTMFAGGAVIFAALWDALSNSPADYKRERPMPPGAGGADF